MTEPVRLLSSETTNFERWLLEAAREEHPGSELEAKMLSATTVAALGGASAAATAGSESVSGAGASSIDVSGRAVSGRGWALAGKWIGGAVGVSLLGFFVARVSTETPERASETATRVATPTEERKAPEATDSAVTAPTAPAPAEPQAVRAPAPSKPAARSADASRPLHSIDDELRLLERARAALAANSPDGALRILATYASRHPRGQLQQEAVVLRVQALEARGESEEAKKLADEFVKKNPTSAHAPQVDR